MEIVNHPVYRGNGLEPIAESHNEVIKRYLYIDSEEQLELDLASG